MGMTQPQKFDRLKMFDLLREGKSQKEAAKILGVSTTAVCRAAKVLRVNVVKTASLEAAHLIVQRQLNVMDQLHNINKHTRTILEDLMAKIKQKSTKTTDVKGMKDLRALALDAAAENRQQLNFQMEAFKTLSDFKVMAEFQKEVLDVVGNANKCPACGEEIKCIKCGMVIDLSAEIIKRLKAAKDMRASVQVRP